jgi:hypothetical protein
VSPPDAIEEALHAVPSGDDKEVTDDDADRASAEKAKGVQAISEKKYDQALKHFSASLQANPKSALTIAGRPPLFFSPPFLPLSLALPLACNAAT